MKLHNRHNQTRFDDDYGGNHWQRERDLNSAPRIQLQPQWTRLCHKCKKRKAAKGGTGIGIKDGFVCSDCNKAANYK